MEIVKFEYCNKEYYFKDHLVFTGTILLDWSEEKINDVFIKFIRDKNSYSLKGYWNLSDKELLEGMIIKELPKPHTFPKFDNEHPFQIHWFGKNIKNPTIISIRWSGYIWEYRIKNIGHEYDYQPESSLEKI
jgi:hypothetical protein